MLKRDKMSGHIISYTNDADKLNRGKLNVPVLDGRFLKEEFERIISTKFTDLPEAARAEEVVVNKIIFAQSNMVTGLVPLPSGYTIPPEIANNPAALEQFTKDIAKKEFLTNISNLIDDSSNSVAALSMKVESLNKEIENKDMIINNQIEAISNFDNVLTTISNERSKALVQLENQTQAINSIQQIVDEQNQQIQDLLATQYNQSVQIAEDAQLSTIIAFAEILSGSLNE
jgi:hypothetical protein